MIKLFSIYIVQIPIGVNTVLSVNGHGKNNKHP